VDCALGLGLHRSEQFFGEQGAPPGVIVFRPDKVGGQLNENTGQFFRADPLSFRRLPAMVRQDVESACRGRSIAEQQNSLALIKPDFTNPDLDRLILVSFPPVRGARSRAPGILFVSPFLQASCSIGSPADLRIVAQLP
jgi:hypothetical protein